VVRISSIAAAFIALREGLEPVMQMTCRDRNRIAMQADLLGAAALGLKNCLCIAGDHQKFSAAGKLKGHPGAKNVYDVDTCQLVGIMKKMRDESLQEGGDKIEVPPKFFIGASWTPWETDRLPSYNLRRRWTRARTSSRPRASTTWRSSSPRWRRRGNLGLHERTAILGGIIVPGAP